MERFTICGLRSFVDYVIESATIVSMVFVAIFLGT